MMQIFMVLAVCFTLVMPCFAADEAPEEAEAPEYDPIPDVIIGANRQEEEEGEPTLVGISLLTSVAPVTADDTDGLKSIILSLIGDYDPVVVEYEYRTATGNAQYLREIEPDYAWLCSCAIFLVVIYSIFRLGGAMCRK